MAKKTQSEKFTDWLIANPEFRKDVQEIRRFFGVPDNGFTEEKATRTFVKKFSDESLEKARDKEFIKKMNQLRADRTLGKLSDEEYRSKVQILEQQVPQFVMDQKIKMLRLKHKIASPWFFGLFNHIITGDRFDTQSCVPGIFLTPDGSESQIRITVDANATLADLKGIWPTVQEFQKRLKDHRPKQLRQAKNFERDAMVVELRFQGLSYPKIAERVNEVCKEKHWPPVHYDYIPKILKRYKVRGGR